MPEKKDNQEKSKRVERFIYSEDDVEHIFRLGDIGGVFNTQEGMKKSNTLLKKLITNNKKMKK